MNLSRRAVHFAALSAGGMMMGCAPRTGAPIPTRPDEVCPDLESHTFGPPGLCGSDPQVDFVYEPVAYQRLLVRGDAVAACFWNALVEWRADGTVSGLLGLASVATPAFDWRTSAVTQLCDGSISVWRDGCLAHEQPAHARAGDPVVQDLSGSVAGLGLSPDGKILFSLGGDGRLLASDLGSGIRHEARAKSGHAAKGLALSPDGARLAVRSRDAVELFDADGLAPIAEVPLESVRDVGFRPGGQLVALSGNSLVEIDDGTPGRRIELGTKFAVALAADEDRTVVAGVDGVWLVAADGADSLLVDAPNTTEVAFSEDGAVIYGLRGDGIDGYDAATGDKVVTMAAPGEPA